jgi:hypothetical protein
MLGCTVFLTCDFLTVALVVCSEEEVVAHGFDRLSHPRSAVDSQAAGQCGVEKRVGHHYGRPSAASQVERAGRGMKMVEANLVEGCKGHFHLLLVSTQT